jgi:hypothetical protein
MPITVEAIKMLPDDELDRFIAAAADEKKARTERKKQETIARIRQLAGSVGVRIAIGGVRGRPVKAGAHENGKKAEPENGNAAMPVKKTG